MAENGNATKSQALLWIASAFVGAVTVNWVLDTVTQQQIERRLSDFESRLRDFAEDQKDRREFLIKYYDDENAELEGRIGRVEDRLRGSGATTRSN